MNSMNNDIRALSARLKKAATVLDELLGNYSHNETPETAEKIVNSLKRRGTKPGQKRGPYKKVAKRKNPWKNPQYRAKQLKNLAKTRAKKSAKNGQENNSE